MNNLRILLYVVVLSLAACHPEGTNVKQGLDKAAQLMGQDPDTASIILENIQIKQMNNACNKCLSTSLPTQRSTQKKGKSICIVH